MLEMLECLKDEYRERNWKSSVTLAKRLIKKLDFYTNVRTNSES